MYKLKNGEGTVYETFDELLNADIESVFEDENNYYFHLVPECYFENAMWVVNKKTYEVSYMMFTKFRFEILDTESVREIKPDLIKASH